MLKNGHMFVYTGSCQKYYPPATIGKVQCIRYEYAFKCLGCESLIWSESKDEIDWKSYSAVSKILISCEEIRTLQVLES
jgi:hypothetical protein